LGVFTILGEELGWRGFLQDALRPMKPMWRYLLIGIMWELWHFTNRTHDRTVLQAVTGVAVFGVITILLSWLIGMAADRSKSVLLATAMHGWVDLVFEFPGIGTYISAGFAVVLWLYMLKIWPQQSKEETAPVAEPIV
jgi:membrane protease YdiL (CAAX protease family)